jgi:hypothetical protein
MWRFMSLADSVFNRVDDSNGTVGDVFRSACNDLATLASEAKPDPETLAARVFAAITDNGYGVFDDLVKIVFPALGETGVARLKSKLDAALAGCLAKLGTTVVRTASDAPCRTWRVPRAMWTDTSL